MKKKALIIATTLLIVIALTVGVTFAVWNVNAKSHNFDAKIGKNIDLKVTFAGYNGAAEADNVYTGSDTTQVACDDKILIPNGAELKTDVNNAYTVLYGTFKITENGGWDAETLKAVYTLKTIKLGELDLSKAENALYNVFDVKVLSAVDVAIDTDYISKSIPKVTNTPLLENKTALTLNAIYYVFVSFKADFNGKAIDFMDKSLTINLEINAAATAAIN